MCTEEDVNKMNAIIKKYPAEQYLKGYKAFLREIENKYNPEIFELIPMEMLNVLANVKAKRNKCFNELMQIHLTGLENV